MFILAMMRPETENDTDWVETEIMQHESYDVVLFHWNAAIEMHLAAKHPDPRAEVWFYAKDSSFLAEDQYYWAWSLDDAYDEDDEPLGCLEEQVIASGYKYTQINDDTFKKMYSRIIFSKESLLEVYNAFVKTGISIET